MNNDADKNATADNQAGNNNESKTVHFTVPIKRGSGKIKSVALRKPHSGELRGLNLMDVLQVNMDALATLLPRITDPTLTKSEIGTIDPADLISLGAAVSLFFASPED